MNGVDVRPVAEYGLNAGNDSAGTPKCLETQHWTSEPFDGPVVLFNDVVEALVLTPQDIDVSVSHDALNSCCIGAALVDGDLV